MCIANSPVLCFGMRLRLTGRHNAVATERDLILQFEQLTTERKQLLTPIPPRELVPVVHAKKPVGFSAGFDQAKVTQQSCIGASRFQIAAFDSIDCRSYSGHELLPEIHCLFPLLGI